MTWLNLCGIPLAAGMEEVGSVFQESLGQYSEKWVAISIVVLEMSRDLHSATNGVTINGLVYYIVKISMMKIFIDVIIYTIQVIINKLFKRIFHISTTRIWRESKK